MSVLLSPAAAYVTTTAAIPQCPPQIFWILKTYDYNKKTAVDCGRGGRSPGPRLPCVYAVALWTRGVTWSVPRFTRAPKSVAIRGHPGYEGEAFINDGVLAERPRLHNCRAVHRMNSENSCRYFGPFAVPYTGNRTVGAEITKWRKLLENSKR